MQGFFDAGLQQDFTGTALGSVTVHLGKLDFELSDFHTIRLTHLCQAVNTVTFALHGPKLSITHDHSINHTVFLKGKLVLAQSTNLITGSNRDIARGWHQGATEDFHECRLATAIGTNQAVLIAVAELG